MQTEDASGVETALRDALGRLGYSPYDPFPGGIGTPPGLKDFVRMFLSPAAESWVALVRLAPARRARCDGAAMEACGPVLLAWLDGASSDMARFTQGAPDAHALDTFLRPGTSR